MPTYEQLEDFVAEVAAGLWLDDPEVCMLVASSLLSEEK